jgi:SAM-dependent methyltransferase
VSERTSAGNDAEVAATYDTDHAAMFADDVVGPAVDVLADLAGGGRALEMAAGTGRIALPLRARGVDVVGVELSRPMVDRLRAKRGGDALPVVVGDMSTVTVDGHFSLVYLVFNTITNLPTQDAQLACFCNAAAHLEPGGHFVIETFVPALRRLPPGSRFVPFDVSERHVGVDEYDVVRQRLLSRHVWPAEGRSSVSEHRYAWPAEYDLMARLAGMTLRHRWADWSREPFTAESTTHVSVWRRPATG